MRVPICRTRRNARLCPRPIPLHASEAENRRPIGTIAAHTPLAISLQATQRAAHHCRVRVALLIKADEMRAHSIQREPEHGCKRTRAAVRAPLFASLDCIL